MFAVYGVGGAQAPYVRGQFRTRKVTKVSKVSVLEPIGQDDQSSEQPSLLSSSFSPVRFYEQVQALSQATPSAIVARDIMTSPVTTLSITASLAEAWEMVKHQRFRHIPIQSQNGELVGILSDRDLSRGTVETALSGTKGAADLAEVTIEKLVSHPVLVAALEATILAIARVLLEERIGAIPVVSQDQKLLGMITRSDILRVIVSHPNFEQWG